MAANSRNWPVRTAVIPTTSYVAGTIIGSAQEPLREHQQCILYVTIAFGSLDSVQIRLRSSPDAVLYGTETDSTTATTTALNSLVTTPAEHSFAAAIGDGTYEICFPIAGKRYIEVATKGTGTLTSSSVAIQAVTYGVV